MQTSVIGYPRIGSVKGIEICRREILYRGEIGAGELNRIAAELRSAHWNVRSNHAGSTSSRRNDFSFYDHVLDTAVLFNLIPERYRALELDPLDTYFAMATGLSGTAGRCESAGDEKMVQHQLSLSGA